MRDLFYAANTFWTHPADKRARLPLPREIEANETASVKVIGLTLETRPDTVSHAQIRRLREYGCTRVQLGVQHTDDAILAKVSAAPAASAGAPAASARAAPLRCADAPLWPCAAAASACALPPRCAGVLRWPCAGALTAPLRFPPSGTTHTHTTQ